MTVNAGWEKIVGDLCRANCHHAEAVSGGQIHGASINPATIVGGYGQSSPSAHRFGEIVDVGTSEVELIVPLAEDSLNDLNRSRAAVVNTRGSIVSNARLRVRNVGF